MSSLRLKQRFKYLYKGNRNYKDMKTKPKMQDEIEEQEERLDLSSDWTRLMKASFKGEIGLVKRFLDDGDDLNKQTTATGRSALIISVEHGNQEVVEVLLKNGATVDMRTSFQSETALMKACENGHRQIAKLLMEHGAKVNLQNRSGLTALMMASCCAHSEVVELLLNNGASVDIQNRDGDSALIQSIWNTQIRVAELLLDHGANVNMQNADGNSPLIVASEIKSVEFAKMILRYFAEVNLLSHDGESALMIACANADSKLVELLLESGSEVNLQNGDGVSALMESRSGTVAVQLLRNGADVDLLSKDGLSALMLACDRDDAEMAELLLANGACINQRSSTGHTPLLIAIEHGNMEMVRLLVQNGVQVDAKKLYEISPLSTAIKLGVVEIANFLMIQTDIDTQDKDGKSALIYAVENRSMDIASRLIELGAQTDQQDSKGWFPLMYAIKAGDLETVQILIAYGADVSLRNRDGQTILDVCPQELVHHPLFQELFQTLLNEANGTLKINQEYPGIVFYETPVSLHVTSSGATMDHLRDLGISISVPEGSLTSAEESLHLHVRACFHGPFRLPKRYRSASPAYLITHSRKADFQKDITIRIHHHARLASEEDCANMSFLSASSTPEYGESSSPVYTFRKMHGSKMVFTPGEQVGEILLRHFCLLKAVCRKRKKEESSSGGIEKIHKKTQHLYSIRLYRNVQLRGEVSAVFCVCPFSPIFIQHSDSVIAQEYSGMSGKGEGRSQVRAQIVGDRVAIQSTKGTPNVTFDRTPTQIMKNDVHLSKKMETEISRLLDYPPRLLIYTQTQPSTLNSPAELQIQVTGLDPEHTPCYFAILTHSQSLTWTSDTYVSTGLQYSPPIFAQSALSHTQYPSPPVLPLSTFPLLQYPLVTQYPSPPVPASSASPLTQYPSPPVPASSASPLQYPSPPVPASSASLLTQYPSPPVPASSASLLTQYPSPPVPALSASLLTQYPSPPVPASSASPLTQYPSPPVPASAPSPLTQCPSPPSTASASPTSTLLQCPPAAPSPTLPTLVCFPMSDGKVNLAEKIPDYWDFGVLLLDDHSGDQIAAIEKEQGKCTVDINRQILRLWVQGKGRQPVTWNTLVTVLQDIKLVALAKDIENIVSHYQ